MQKLLIVTRHTPLPWEDGAGAYLHDVARFLACAGFRVEMLWLAPHEHLLWQKWWRLPDAFDSSVRLRLPGAIRCGRHYFFPGMVWFPFKARALHRVRRLLEATGLRRPRRGPPPVTAAGRDRHPWASPPSPGELASVEHFARGFRPAAILASYSWMCPVFQLPSLKGARRACLAHDVGWKRALLSAGRNGDSGAPEISREDETGWLRPAGTIVAISESDAEEFRTLAPEATVLVAPKALEARIPVAESSSRGLLFVGSDNAFNTEGLEWFLHEVWPQVRRDVPDATLDVCGSVNRSVVLRPEGVAFHGMVPGLETYYARAAIAIVPLLRSTGLNIKLVEAAAFGRVIVASPNILVGAPFLRDAAVIAGSAAEFASAVRRLLLDPAARAAAADRALAAVQARLAPGVCYGPLAARLLGERRQTHAAAGCGAA